MTGLLHPYPSVKTGAELTYGGNQTLSDHALIKTCGCGVVAALDLVIYLSLRQHICGKAASDEPPIPLSLYNRYLYTLSRKYFPLIPRFGMNGLVLIAGLNRLFRVLSMPYTAEWKISEQKMARRIAEQLERDIPVILAIGPNFPCVWRQNRLTLYKKDEQGGYREYSSAKAHYVTVTGIDKDWMRISSWGKELYISRAEYGSYVETYSTSILSNIVYIHSVSEDKRTENGGNDSHE